MLDTARCDAVGLLPGAAGAMLLPGDAGDGDAAALRAGAWEQLPESWRFLQQLARGEDVQWAGDDPVSRFNAAVLDGDPERVLEAGAGLGPSVQALAEATAFRLGADRPVPGEPGEDIDPRVRAYVLATRGHAAAHDGDAVVAVGTLRRAATVVAEIMPGAGARLLGEAAAVAVSTETADAMTLMDLDRATELLDTPGFDEIRGELLMARAELLMTMGADRPPLLQQAVQCFQRATQALPRRTHPVAYAVCHLNIAVAYLSMPMNEHSDRLRSAIAVQSLREALEILERDTHGELWEAASINLANALQHLPSSHVAENLAEAVDLYRDVLTARTREDLGRARLLGNLGNALAHLGQLDEAVTHLQAARELFAAAAETDSVAGIDGILSEIEATRASAAGGSGGTNGVATTEPGA